VNENKFEIASVRMVRQQLSVMERHQLNVMERQQLSVMERQQLNVMERQQLNSLEFPVTLQNMKHTKTTNSSAHQ